MKILKRNIVSTSNHNLLWKGPGDVLRKADIKNVDGRDFEKRKDFGKVGKQGKQELIKQEIAIFNEKYDNKPINRGLIQRLIQENFDKFDIDTETGLDINELKSLLKELQVLLDEKINHPRHQAKVAEAAEPVAETQETANEGLYDSPSQFLESVMKLKSSERFLAVVDVPAGKEKVVFDACFEDLGEGKFQLVNLLGIDNQLGLGHFRHFFTQFGFAKVNNTPGTRKAPASKYKPGYISSDGKYLAVYRGDIIEGITQETVTEREYNLEPPQELNKYVEKSKDLNQQMASNIERFGNLSEELAKVTGPGYEHLSMKQRYQLAAMMLAVKMEKETGISAIVCFAQTIQETGHGNSIVGNNCFGIKPGSKWAGKVSEGVMTHEYRDGSDQPQDEEANFRAYDSIEDSFRNYADFMHGDRYKQALTLTAMPQKYAEYIHQAGYATDPNYVTNLGGVLSHYGFNWNTDLNAEIERFKENAKQDFNGENYTMNADGRIAAKAERSSSGTTLCSRTARILLREFAGITHRAPSGASAIASMRLNERRYGKLPTEFQPNSSENCVDIFVSSSSQYGHRAFGYKHKGEWLVVDPYRGAANGLPYSEYVNQQQAKGYNILGLKFHIAAPNSPIASCDA